MAFQNAQHQMLCIASFQSVHCSLPHFMWFTGAWKPDGMNGNGKWMKQNWIQKHGVIAPSPTRDTCLKFCQRMPRDGSLKNTRAEVSGSECVFSKRGRKMETQAMTQLHDFLPNTPIQRGSRAELPFREFQERNGEDHTSRKCGHCLRLVPECPACHTQACPCLSSVWSNGPGGGYDHERTDLTEFAEKALRRAVCFELAPCLLWVLLLGTILKPPVVFF